MFTRNEDNLNDKFLMATQEGNLELVSVLLGQPLISLNTFDTAIQQASQKGDHKIVECLLGDSRVNPGIAVFSAVKNGQLKVLQLLLNHPDANPGGLKNIAIREASEQGNLEMVECLLKDTRVNPCDLENDAIRKASKNGHLKIVERLIKDPRVNPSDFQNDALALAGINGHIEVMKLLLTCPKVYQNSNNLVFQDICLGGNLEAVQMLIKHTKVQEKCISDAIIDGKIQSSIRNYLKFVQQTRNESKSSRPNRSIKEIQQNLDQIIVTTRINFTNVQGGKEQHQQTRDAKMSAEKREQEKGTVTSSYFNQVLVKFWLAKMLLGKELPKEINHHISCYVCFLGFSESQLNSYNHARNQLAMISQIVNWKNFWPSSISSQASFLTEPGALPTFFEPVTIALIKKSLAQHKKMIPTELYNAVLKVVRNFRDNEKGSLKDSSGLLQSFVIAVRKKTLSEFIEKHQKPEATESEWCLLQ